MTGRIGDTIPEALIASWEKVLKSARSTERALQAHTKQLQALEASGHDAAGRASLDAAAKDAALLRVRKKKPSWVPPVISDLLEVLP